MLHIIGSCFDKPKDIMKGLNEYNTRKLYVRNEGQLHSADYFYYCGDSTENLEIIEIISEFQVELLCQQHQKEVFRRWEMSKYTGH